jgi:hypothetical protein
LQVKKCKDFFELHKKTLWRDQVRILRGAFASKDMEVQAGESQYSTTPSSEFITESEPPQSKTTAGLRFHANQRNETPRVPSPAQDLRRHPNGRRGDDLPHRGNDRPQRGNDRNQRGSGRLQRDNDRPRRGETPQDSKGVRKSVPGYRRCVTCGDPTNHFGLGSSVNTCPVVGTEYAKSSGYVWKNSDVEKAVYVPFKFYKERLQNNPKIEQNWKSAKAQKASAQVAAMAVEHHDDPSDDELVPAYDDSDAGMYEDADNKSESDYLSSAADSALATQPPTDCTEQNTAQIAALATHPLELFGYMPQFFGVVRFAQNDELCSKCLMDDGASINVISPTLANTSTIDRRPMDVAIYTGKKKVATISEMVKVVFELMAADGSFVKHSEWFSVSDMGYSMVLGRKFCFDNGLSLFDSKLKSFDSFAVSNPEVVAVAAMSVVKPAVALSPPSKRIYFSRVADSNRAAKAITALYSSTSCSNIISPEELAATSPLTKLLICDQSSDNDVDKVLLEFAADRSPQNKLQRWFTVDKAMKSGCHVDAELALLLGIIKPATIDSKIATPVLFNVAASALSAREIGRAHV